MALLISLHDMMKNYHLQHFTPVVPSFAFVLCASVLFLLQMPRMEDILNLPVQDPPSMEFSAAHLNWAKVEGGRQGGDDIALIPFARVDDFVKGESTKEECPASFRIESRRKRPEGSVSKPRVDGYLEYTLYVLLCKF